MQEARELANDPSTDYTAAPLEDDIFEWHCTIRGAPGTEFEGGLYHFRILLPSEYPFRPPSIMMLTPNGRFELNTKICISFTNYHEELWQPAWGVRTAIVGLQGFFPLKGTAAVGVGALEYPSVERRRLAAISREWVCSRCGKCNLESLPDPDTPSHNHSETPIENAAENTDEASTPISTAVEKVTQSAPSDSNNSNQPIEPLHDIAPTVTPPLKVVAPTPTRPIGPTPLVTAGSSSSSSPTLVSEAEEDPNRPAALDIRIPGAERPPIIIRRSTPRPPIVLDTAICVLLVLVFALICRRIL
ncbi:unnamed protein product [Somion occarium]